MATHVLFFSKNSQNRPDKKNINDIIKYSSGSGISPADKKLLLFASSMSICGMGKNTSLLKHCAIHKWCQWKYLPGNLAGINCAGNLDKRESTNCTVPLLVRLKCTWQTENDKEKKCKWVRCKMYEWWLAAHREIVKTVAIHFGNGHW